MKRKLMLFMTCLVISIGLVNAQTTSVTGTVISEEDGLPVVGASIRITGTDKGTVTDIDGKFSIANVPSSAKTLTISYIGMQTQEVEIKPNMRIVLKTDNAVLDEVVVTAMGIKRSEKALGYSATAVDNEQITATRSSDIMSSLAGKVAGVQISSTSSDPGSSNSVIIRGISSLNGNNQPLYVIDGVPLTNETTRSDDELNNGFDFGNGANAVNPDDVESMTILKGAAATALYGSRAANGVVMITTKSGKKGSGLGIEYNGGLQWSTVLRLPEFQNEFGQGAFGSPDPAENGSWGPRFNGQMRPYGWGWGDVEQRTKPYVANEDNMKDFFDSGFRYSNSLSFNGATDRSDYFVSFSQTSDDGIMPTDADSYDKYTFSARGSHSIGNLKFSTSLNYSTQKNKFAATGQGLSALNAVYQTPRDISITDMADMSNIHNTPGYYYTWYGLNNPYYTLENYLNAYESERFYGKFQVDYDFLKYFKFTYRLGLDTTTGQQDIGVPNLNALFYTDDVPNGTQLGASSPFYSITGSYTQQISRRREINHDIMVNFNMPINDFHVNALVGFNGNERSYSYQQAEVTNLTLPTWFNLTNSPSTPLLTTNKELRRLMGVFGQFEGSWKNMVYVTVTARNDWSSTLPKNERSFFYPGVTGSFIFSELLKNEWKDIITFGKVRASWGKTGNDADVYMTSTPFIQGQYPMGFGQINLPLNGVNGYTLSNQLGNIYLTPEMTTEYEFGLNMAFLENRISFDLAYYNRNSDKQIFNVNMDPSAGYTSRNMNLGKIRNKGIELLVNFTPVKLRDFSWDVSVNFTRNWSKIISLPEELGGRASLLSLGGGTGMYAITGMPVGVFESAVPERDPNGNMVVSAESGLPVIASDYAVVGDMNNRYQMGISTSFRYKGLTLSADFDIRHGGVMYSNSKSLTYFGGTAIQTAYNGRNTFIIPGSVNKVTGPGGEVSYVENTTPIASGADLQYFWVDGGFDYASAFLIDKSFVKLRSLVIGWDLPNKWLVNTPLQAVRVSVYGNNLFLWTPDSNTFIDPEMTSFGNDLLGNFGEFNANPSTRRFGFNVMVKF